MSEFKSPAHSSLSEEVPTAQTLDGEEHERPVRRRCVGTVVIGLFALLNGGVPFLAGLGVVSMEGVEGGGGAFAQRLLLVLVGGLFVFLGLFFFFGGLRCFGTLGERRTKDAKALMMLGMLLLLAAIFNVLFVVELRGQVRAADGQSLFARLDQWLKVGVVGFLAFVLDAALWELGRRAWELWR